MNNKIGALLEFRHDTDFLKKFKAAVDIGINSCQLSIWNEDVYTDEYAQKVNDAVKETGIEISAVWAGWAGPCEWNFKYGPSTIGLVPVAYRDSRVKALKKAADFAAKIGVKKIITHAGFIPENPADENFSGTVGALRNVCGYLKSKKMYFLFETGQETPVTLLRTIQAIATDNVGINLDTANLILYGKANTLDALDVFGKYVMETHIKDGFYPTDGMNLGKEVFAGQGKANLPAVVKKLGELGYTGNFTIEREIYGEQQQKDIAATKELLIKWMQEA